MPFMLCTCSMSMTIVSFARTVRNGFASQDMSLTVFVFRRTHLQLERVAHATFVPTLVEANTLDLDKHPRNVARTARTRTASVLPPTRTAERGICRALHLLL